MVRFPKQTGTLYLQFGRESIFNASNKLLGDSSVVFPAFELILVAKNLERIGDHATNIAEDVMYIVQGLDVRHPAVDRA